MAVVDDTWAAGSLMNVIVREGQPQTGLDFTLGKGTLLRGQVTEGPDHRSLAGATVMLIENGEVLPRDFRGVRGNKGQLPRANTATDCAWAIPVPGRPGPLPVPKYERSAPSSRVGVGRGEGGARDRLRPDTESSET